MHVKYQIASTCTSKYFEVHEYQIYFEVNLHLWYKFVSQYLQVQNHTVQYVYICHLFVQLFDIIRTTVGNHFGNQTTSATCTGRHAYTDKCDLRGHSQQNQWCWMYNCTKFSNTEICDLRGHGTCKHSNLMWCSVHSGCTGIWYQKCGYAHL